MNNKTWKCHAKPAREGGKTCGHLNSFKTETPKWDSLSQSMVSAEYCARCGCHKHASDLRATVTKKGE